MTDIAEIILTAINNAVASPEQGPAYFCRPRGSYIPALRASDDEALAALSFLRGLATSGRFVEVTDLVRAEGGAFGACRYFRAEDAADGIEAAVPLGELFDDELALVRVVRGAHGDLELVAPSVKPKPTSSVTIVVGNGANPKEEADGGTLTVFTWFPGRTFPPALLESKAAKLG